MKKSILAFLFLALMVSCKGRDKEQAAPDTGPTGIAAVQQKLEGFERDYKDNPQDEVARNNVVAFSMQLGRYFEDKNEFSKAEDYYRKALSVQPDYLAAQYYLGSVLTSSGKHSEAIEELEGVVRVNPGYTAELYNLLAENYIQTGQRDRAKDALLKSIVIKPGNIETYRELARLYSEDGKAEESALQEAMAADLEKWRYPDRGYLEKTLEEWKKENKSLKQQIDALPPTEKADYFENPLVKRRALVMYNIATYFDRSLDPEDFTTYEKAMKHWNMYREEGAGKNKDEEAYKKLIKDRVKVLKEEKEASLKSKEILKPYKLLKRIQEAKSNMENYRDVLQKVEVQARSAAVEEDVKRVEDLKARFDTLDMDSIISALSEMYHKTQSLIDGNVSGESYLTEHQMTAKVEPMFDELDKMADEVVAKGLGDMVSELRLLAGKYRIEWPKASKH